MSCHAERVGLEKRHAQVPNGEQVAILWNAGCQRCYVVLGNPSCSRRTEEAALLDPGTSEYTGLADEDPDEAGVWKVVSQRLFKMRV